MDEKELRSLQRSKNAEVNKLRSEGKFVEAKALREEVLQIATLVDQKQQERFKEYQKIADESEEAISAEIQAEAAIVVAEAERILGG